VADLAAEALFGESSPLYLKLYEEGHIDSSFGGGFETIDGCAMLLCSGDSEAPETVRQALLEQAAKISAEGIPEDVFLQELLMHRGDCSFCTKLLEASLYREGEGMRFPIGELNEDFNLLVHSLKKIGPIVSLPKQCYHVFYRVGSNSRKADKESFSRVYADNVTNADRVMKLVQKEYPKLLAVAFRFGIFQRIDYLLHIPISQMQKDNEVYRGIVRYMRRNWCRALRNSILTKKDKLYHTLFALAPKIIRSVHRKLRG
jgi:hypothetical protein